ncbi:MAG: SlyX family protein [Succinivibrionaceae bacterium]|nr:SlyX family protein [Succinivibrionaceae bacterium]
MQDQKQAPGEPRLDKIEERVAWLEMMLIEAEGEISILQDRCEELERQVRFLSSQVEPPSAVAPMSEEVPPPHY